MDDRIADRAVTLVARTDPLDADAAVETMEHVADYDVPGEFSNRISNVADLDPEFVGTAQFVFADHVPGDWDPRREEPNVFFATHEDDRLQVAFSAYRDSLDEFVDALEHVLAATDLTVEFFRVMFRIRGDVTGDHPAEGFEAPEGFGVDVLDVDDERGRSVLGLRSLGATDRRLSENADPVYEHLDSTTAAADELLP